jgi:cell division protein FtsI/penicillin-binding protein 2
MALRLFDLQFNHYKYYRGLAKTQHWSANRIPAERGSIYLQDLSSNTRFPVAINDQRSLIYAVPGQIKDQKDVAARLGGFLGMSQSDVLTKFSYSTTYTIIAHRVDQATSDKIKNAKLAGIYMQDEHVREYPEGQLASSVIGFTNSELVGQYGIERSFNQQLSGTDGFLSSERDSNGVPIVDGSKVDKPSQDGADLVLTIDRNIQQAAEASLKNWVDQYHATAGSVAMMDPSTGRILAMASYPTYDPNHYADVTDYSAYGDQPVEGSYEPGSIFKMITMASGVDSGKIQPTTPFNDTGQVTVQGHVIQNADHKAHGQIDMNYVLARSLNVGTVYALSKIGDPTFYNYVKKFGFGTQTGIELDNESSGSVQAEKDLQQIDFATITFGQGIAVTPLQMLSAAQSIANDGKMVQPHIVDRIIYSNGHEDVTQTRITRQVVSSASAKTLTAMLVNAVDNGWGQPAAIAGYTVAGKTGTAQIPRSDGKGYEDTDTIGSFVGYVPANNPRFVMIARLDRPKGVSFSEEPAAHLWHDVAQFALNYFEVAPDRK